MKTRGRGGREEGAEEEEKSGGGKGGRGREESRTRGHRSYERGVKDERAGEGGRSAGALFDVETPRRKKEKGEERREGEKEPRPR